MNTFPKSTYFRILENKLRGIEKFRPDYPLVFFMLLSRLSFGLGIITGALVNFSDQFKDIVTAGTVVSSAAMLTAILASFVHLGSPAGFMRMIRNPRSMLTWEIILSGLFLIVQIINILTLCLNITTLWIVYTMGWIVSIAASAAVISTGLVFRFPTHPVWNSKLLPILYFVSSLILGSSCILVMANLFNERLLREPLSDVLTAALLLLILVQLGLTYEYGRRSPLKRRLQERAAGVTGKLLCIYAGFYYLFPIIWLSLSMPWGRLEFLPSAVLAVCLLVGVFVERVLFFILENPSFFFSFANNKVALIT